jgi:hypothetical protein
MGPGVSELETDESLIEPLELDLADDKGPGSVAINPGVSNEIDLSDVKCLGSCRS